MDLHQLAPDEPLSPELVLVFSPELRAQALARLPAPVWPTPRRREAEAPAAPVAEQFAPSVVAILVARVTQLALVFAAVTILTLAMALVANAMRDSPRTAPIDQAAQPGHSRRSESRVERYRREVWSYT